MSTTDKEAARIASGAARSQEFTERSSAVAPSGFIDLHNEAQLHLEQDQLAEAEAFLRSGAVQVMIPARNEAQHGYIHGVLEYVEHCVGPENVLVIDADSTDGTGELARSRGFETVAQSDVEACLDMDRMIQDFALQDPIRGGKGRTVMAATLYQRLMHTDRLQRLQFNAMSDADISNPFDFNHIKYLAWVAANYPPDVLLEVRAAQHDRNNQIVMDKLASMQANNPVMLAYYLKMMETIWPLTGQMMKRPGLMQNAVNNVGYSTEIISGMSAVDYADAHGMRRAQVEVPVRCRDGANDDQKENEMMVGISATADMMNREIFARGLRLADMQPEDYRRLNLALQQSEPLYVPTMDMVTGRNHLTSIRADVIMPPVAYLLDNGYVDFDKVRKLRNKQEAQQWTGYTAEPPSGTNGHQNGKVE